MPNQISSGLIASLLILVLTACGGSGNVPAVAADETVKTTELKPQAQGMIDPVNPCIANPFGDTCGAEFNDTRKAICANERTSQRCLTTVSMVCNADSLDALCAGNKTYFAAQKTACEGELTSRRCAPTIVRVCDENVFDTFCDNNRNYQRIRDAMVNDCRTNRNDSCTNAVAKSICADDPFDNLCDNSYFSAQVIFCTMRENVTLARCETIFGTDESATIANACLANPFDSSCDTDTNFTNYLIEARANRFTFCEARFARRSNFCTEIFTQPNSATWLKSFSIPLDISPRVRPGFSQENEFLKDITNESNDFENITTLTLASNGLGGQETDGVAFFAQNPRGIRDYYYAGLISGTQLGEVVSGTSGTSAVWNGRFQTMGNIPLDKDFEITINFGAGEQAGQIDAFVKEDTSDFTYYYLTGDFDSEGVITGKVNYGDFHGRIKTTPERNRRPNGELTGLIGQEGVVGVFFGWHYETITYSSGTIRTVISPVNWAGGFVAVPPK